MEKRLYAMHNTVRFMTRDGMSEEEWEKISAFFRYVDAEWSRFTPDSEVSRLNGLRIGESLRVSLPLARLLRKATRYLEQTDRLFSPYLLEQQQANGYSQSFPFTEAVAQTVPSPEQAIPFEIEERHVTRVGGGRIDLGGIGKGAAAMQAAQLLRKQHARGMVEAGGDVIVWSDGTPWTIDIIHPETGQEMTQLTLRQGGVATSNRRYRSWKTDQEDRHHLLDGRTGRSVTTSVVQVTAIANQLYDAEVMTKVAFQLTAEERQDLLFDWFPNAQLLVVEASSEITLEKKGERMRWNG
ncbi:FAD:protein FMN transferase [Exiguobacterium flavidum]|uniref:FAD:protein FMN transferase n=1 Tax=Exiguobacterium flavidum TaxID=2184695 RepID=UPI000DF83642|nr:FAD:protein FMN transferase [Exiguobacterium flavidum]